MSLLWGLVRRRAALRPKDNPANGSRVDYLHALVDVWQMVLVRPYSGPKSVASCG